MDDILSWLNNNYIGGFLFLTFGIGIIRMVYNSSEGLKRDIFQGYLSGWAAGIGFILIGIIILIYKLIKDFS